jgi:hypothetical protein
VIGSIGRFLKLLDLGLEILEVLLFSFAESTLRGAVLRLALLHAMSVLVMPTSQDETYCRRFRC